MRVLCAVDRVEVAPGSSVEIPLEVVNTGHVIEGVGLRARGSLEEFAHARPERVALFPDASGTVTAVVDVPAAFPAGAHPLALLVTGNDPAVVAGAHEVLVVVGVRPALAVEADPAVARAWRKAEFAVDVVNKGNVLLDVALRADDADRSLRAKVTPSSVSVAPGERARCTVEVRGPRHLVGSDRDRALRLDATAAEQQATVPLVLRQRPLIGRGLLTTLTLVAIVGMWAAVSLLGIRAVLGQDPLTRVAPASFFAASGSADGAAGGVAGAVPKDGAVAAGVGGVLSGQVRGAVDPAGVGRITVEVIRLGRDGPVVVSSAATQADGGYTVAGLLPGAYHLRFSAEGYDDVWYPQAPALEGSDPVRATAGEVTDGVDAVITGHEAALRGTVTLADDDEVVTVTARPTWAGGEALSPWEATAAADGTYVLAGLPAPGSYEVTFNAEGYAPTTLAERVLGGQERFVTDVRLGAGSGQITGRVTDGGAGLGGVVVSTTVDGKTLEVGTPTTGTVGAYVLTGLPTPGTYVLTFAKDGHASRTLVVDLGPGEQRTGADVALRAGAGTITGKVTDAAGAGLGGATVRLGGSSTAAVVTTLTQGDVGAFQLTGLAGAGSYTVTVELAGHAAATVPVVVGSDGSSAPVRVTLTSAVGAVSGRVLNAGVAVGGASVEVTDGKQTWRTTSASGTGAFTVGSLEPRRYTVRVLQGAQVVAATLVTVTAGGVASQDVDLTAGS